MNSLEAGPMLQAGLARSTTGGLEAEGCGITKYSSAHSFNPLLVSKSTQNLSVKKVDFSPEKIPFYFCFPFFHAEMSRIVQTTPVF